jgi:radical SAM superfamily enzyme YgiQ (UPF0313 family)
MLSMAILDCNSTLKDDDHFVEITSVVGQWLRYEVEKAGLIAVSPADCDVLFLVHSGELDFRWNVREGLKRLGIEWDAEKRKRPYIITGGAVDTAPFMALTIADGLAVGEAYTFVREVLRIVKTGGDVQDIRAYITAYPHALERQQLADFEADRDAPWLLTSAPPALASPDPYVDWGDMPAFVSDDNVARLMASKGCHLKCTFCATTYRQTYRVNDRPDILVQQMRELKANKQGVSFITNDAGELPFLEDVVNEGMLQFQSMTVKSMRDPHTREIITRRPLKIVRFGVEGISERIRVAFGKSISNAELLDLLHDLRHIYNAEQDKTRAQMVRLFFIVGAPYEDESDWDNLREFILGKNGLAKQVEQGVVQLKFTAFNPQPPTPLMYFVPSRAYWLRYQQLENSMVISRAEREQHTGRFSNHVWVMSPRSPKNHARDFADNHQLTPSQANALFNTYKTRDLAPTVDHARRFGCEVIRWPIPLEIRYRASRVYQKRMTT